ncbi:hypothetical protein [Actinoplanes rectilineatus]|uniref:hypothetical protein n=1 Tax=Actinoplanes rectilineatus TaxID=113571 RepID=UPI0005F29F32|nr:hypothetical protein [Actinoplanes rectilineatus]
MGGPLGGELVTVDHPDGFLAVDKLNGLAWRYLPGPDRTWLLDTSHDNSLIYPHGPTTGERRIDWDRLPLDADPMPVVSLGDSPEAHAGDPCDGFEDAEEAP